MRLVLLGPPGAGKGTQGSRLSARLGAPHVVVGDLLRSVSMSESPVRTTVEESLTRGELVPDTIVDDVVFDAISQKTGGFILDGYPRTREQAVRLDRTLSRFAAPVDAAVVFRIPDDEVQRRLLLRRRPDDTADAIRRRLEIHHRNELAVVDHYGGVVVELDARGHVDEVADRLLDALREAASTP